MPASDADGGLLREVQEFLATRGADSLGGGRQWSLKRPSGGTTSRIYFARPADAPPESSPLCCVRAFGQRGSWLHYCRSLQCLADYSLNGPRLLASSPRWSSWWKRPLLLAESFSEGPLLCDVPLDANVARGVGRSIAKMHAHTAPWFELGNRRFPARACAPRLIKRTRRQIERVRAAHAKDQAISGEIAGFQQWLERTFAAWRPPDRFPFTHSALGADDMIWQPSRGEIALIDLGLMGHQHRGVDLPMVRRALEKQAGAAAPEILAAFDDAYWAVIGMEERERWNREAPLFDALRALARWSSLAKPGREAAAQAHAADVDWARGVIRQSVLS